MGKLQFLFTYFLIYLLIPFWPETGQKMKVCMAFPILSTDSRWIVDQTGRRVKLACVNWVSHLEPMLAEGLSRKPATLISRRIKEMGFNCVRLTWPLFLITNDSLSSLTVRQSFHNLGLLDSIAGLQDNNPSIVDQTLLEAYKVCLVYLNILFGLTFPAIVFQAVVASLAENNVMVILDNHISKSGWCCSNSDGNGFFGDMFFNPEVWINGLTKMAGLFTNASNVVGMSLRNELRGPKQNVNDWFKYMKQGAEAVHSANPNILIILSGLSYDTDLSFLQHRTLNLTFTDKAVFELHWYSFTQGTAWETGNPNQVCGETIKKVKNNGGFLINKGYPLFVSEFGIELKGTNVNDNRYFNCFMSFIAEFDLDWALWTLVGSYYLREGTSGFDETYGLYSWNWGEDRNSSFLQRISAVQSPFQGPDLSNQSLHKVIFHPLTGLCVTRKLWTDPLKLGPCKGSSYAAAWAYTYHKTLTIKGTYFCLKPDKLGKPAKLSIFCTDRSSKWEMLSDSKMHLSSRIDDGSTVCLDIEPDTNVLVTNRCKCLSRSNDCDPGTQWFKLVNSTVRTSTGRSFLSVLGFIKDGFLENLPLM